MNIRELNPEMAQEARACVVALRNGSGELPYPIRMVYRVRLLQQDCGGGFTSL